MAKRDIGVTTLWLLS
ncbi:hypothetical protein D027_1943A, partial [Vibrio parahaemolyticus 861]